MAKYTRTKSDFSVGEVSPRFLGRMDLRQYQGAVKRLENFLPLPTGGIIRRPGTRLLTELGPADSKIRLISFTPNTRQSFLLVLTHKLLRIFPANEIQSVKGSSFSALTELDLPYASSELDDLDFAQDLDVAYFTHPDHAPRKLVYTGQDPPFSFEQEVFDCPPLQKPDTSGTGLQFSDEQWVMRVISTRADEFDRTNLVRQAVTNTYTLREGYVYRIGDPKTADFTPAGAPDNNEGTLFICNGTQPNWNGADAWIGEFYSHIEFRLNGEWVLGRLLFTFTDPAVDQNPSGNTAYIEPVQRIAGGIDPKAKMVVLDSAYDDDIPTNRVEVRSDTLVFNYNLEDSYVRVRSTYDKIRSQARSGSEYGLGGPKHGETYWARIREYLGPTDHPTKFVDGSIGKDDLEVGRVYRIDHQGNGCKISVSAPMEDGQSGQPIVKWDACYHYWRTGQTFSVQNAYWYDQGYSAGGDGIVEESISTPGGPWGRKFKRPPATPNDYTSYNTLISDLSSMKSFDTVRCDPPVTHLSCSSRISIDPEYEKTGHTGVLTASSDFFYNDARNPDGPNKGAFIYGEHAGTRVLYRIDNVITMLQAEVTILDGALPRDRENGELINEGRMDEFRVSEWSNRNWPYTVCFYEGRLTFGGSPKAPDTLWFSKVTNNTDFRTVENDGQVLTTSGISYPLKSRSLNRIVNLTPGRVLIVGTRSSRWSVRPNNFGEGLSPLNIRISIESERGVSRHSLMIGSRVIYCLDSRDQMEEFYYNYQNDGYETQNLNIFTDHFFRNNDVLDFTYSRQPWEMLWVISNDGTLFSMTYIPEQKLYSWARHTTGGQYDHRFIACASVFSEETITEESIAGTSFDFSTERKEHLVFVTLRNNYYVLETLSPEGSPYLVNNFWHKLNFLDAHVFNYGERWIFGDIDEPNTQKYLGSNRWRTAGGRVARTYLAQVNGDGKPVEIYINPRHGQEAAGGEWYYVPSEDYEQPTSYLFGLPFTSEVILPPLSLMTPEGEVYAQKKRYLRCRLLLDESSTLSVGVDPETLYEQTLVPTYRRMSEPAPLISEFREIEIPAGWDYDSELVLAAQRPLPLNIMNTTLEVET